MNMFSFLKKGKEKEKEQEEDLKKEAQVSHN
jgi:hypothetical protein